jgi:hypothetical protein
MSFTHLINNTLNVLLPIKLYGKYAQQLRILGCYGQGYDDHKSDNKQTLKKTTYEQFWR